MTQDELNELQDMVLALSQHDVEVGRVLGRVVYHLAKFSGFDKPVESTPTAPEVEAAPVTQEVSTPTIQEEEETHAN